MGGQQPPPTPTRRVWAVLRGRLAGVCPGAGKLCMLIGQVSLEATPQQRRKEAAPSRILAPLHLLWGASEESFLRPRVPGAPEQRRFCWFNI